MSLDAEFSRLLLVAAVLLTVTGCPNPKDTQFVCFKRGRTCHSWRGIQQAEKRGGRPFKDQYFYMKTAWCWIHPRSRTQHCYPTKKECKYRDCFEMPFTQYVDSWVKH